MISLTRQGISKAPAPQAIGETVVAVRGEPVPPVVERAIAGGGSKKLTRDQKTALVMLAKVAFESVQAVGGDRELKLDDWRAEEAIKACGRRISEAHNRDFSALKAHFLNLAGEAGRAFLHAMRSETEDVRVAMHKLEVACKERGLQLGYPGAICRNQFRCELKDASAKQIWNLVFTVRKRRKVGEGQVKSEKGKEKSEGQESQQQRERKYTVKGGAKARKWEAVELPPVEAEGEDPF